MRPEVALWESYGPLFCLEERHIFPQDLDELHFYSCLRSKYPGICVDIGAGDGRIAGEITTSDLTLAIEPSSAMLEHWTPEHQKTVSRIRSLGDPLPLRSSSIDLLLFAYNLVHCLPGSEERLEMFREAARVLTPEGKLILEACPAFGYRGSEPEVERYSHDEDGISLTLRESISVDRITGTITFHMNYTGGSVPGGSALMNLKLALIGAGELLEELKSSGLCISSVWGDYDLSPWCGGSSPRLLVLLERKSVR